MFVNNLDPVPRIREYNSYSEVQRDMIVYNFLFIKGTTNRNIDRKILGLNPVVSKGWQSMGVLHHLGLKSSHKGIFIDYTIEDAIDILTLQDAEHFKNIIDILFRLKSKKNSSQAFYSWRLLNDKVVLKTVDKSSFIHFGTGIPKKIRDFFEIGNLGKRDKKTIELVYNGVCYKANIKMDALESSRSRMFWKADFRDLLKEVMPKYYNLLLNDVEIEDSKLPQLRFSKIDGIHYDIGFVYPIEIEEDINNEIEEDSIPSTDKPCKDMTPENRKEGGVKYVYGKKYERDPHNRVEAIKYHGTQCVVCGFDFEKIYGARGKGYIEIHHIKPLSTVCIETEVNPKTDLLPVCSNCHKMIHRKKDMVLSIDEMKKLVNKK